MRTFLLSILPPRGNFFLLYGCELSTFTIFNGVKNIPHKIVKEIPL